MQPCYSTQHINFDCREDAVRLGLFIGGFTGSYHLISGALKKWQGSLPPAQNCMAAGTAAGAVTYPPASYCFLPCSNTHVRRVNQNAIRSSVHAAMALDIIHTHDVRCSHFCNTCMCCTIVWLAESPPPRVVKTQPHTCSVFTYSMWCGLSDQICQNADRLPGSDS